eukprot:COSAG01_NODE_12173_length_1786_cov_5.368109_1_plen_116_part_00
MHFIFGSYHDKCRGHMWQDTQTPRTGAAASVARWLYLWHVLAHGGVVWCLSAVAEGACRGSDLITAFGSGHRLAGAAQVTTVDLTADSPTPRARASPAGALFFSLFFSISCGGKI